MTTEELKKITREIVAEARALSVAHTSESDMPVNYACIFTQRPSEYERIVSTARELGPVVEDTAMGPVFHIAPLSTEAGTLGLLKIRRPDPKRSERGDADFTVADYEAFKKTYLGRPGFSLIKRAHMEMLELVDPAYNILAYFSHPTLAEVLGVSS